MTTMNHRLLLTIFKRSAAIAYALTIGYLIVEGILLSLYGDLLGHEDVLYLALLVALLAVGSLGSALIRPWWLNGALLGAAWFVICVVGGVNPNLRWSGMWPTLLVASIIGCITSGTGNLIRSIVSVGMRRIGAVK